MGSRAVDIFGVEMDGYKNEQKIDDLHGNENGVYGQESERGYGWHMRA